MKTGTKVRITKGPLGIVEYLGAASFIEETAKEGETGYVSGIQSQLDGWIYIELERQVDGRLAFVPLHPSWVEEVDD